MPELQLEAWGWVLGAEGEEATRRLASSPSGGQGMAFPQGAWGLRAAPVSQGRPANSIRAGLRGLGPV